ncbi:hypothetical protein ACPW96_22195 [Micromonospora sp. DT81.3]|uniref:hypothetical protein n=1 Tax=Micromonospora sp. DT81.3 TaxID=3416523 RepID=UPI003CEC6E02
MYRLHSPAEPLRPYIENYWFVSHAPGEDVDLRVDVFVDVRADLIFNFEAPYRREIIGGGDRSTPGPTWMRSAWCRSGSGSTARSISSASGSISAGLHHSPGALSPPGTG